MDGSSWPPIRDAKSRGPHRRRPPAPHGPGRPRCVDARDAPAAGRIVRSGNALAAKPGVSRPSRRYRFRRTLAPRRFAEDRTGLLQAAPPLGDVGDAEAASAAPAAAARTNRRRCGAEPCADGDHHQRVSRSAVPASAAASAATLFALHGPMVVGESPAQAIALEASGAGAQRGNGAAARPGTVDARAALGGPGPSGSGRPGGRHRGRPPQRAWRRAGHSPIRQRREDERERDRPAGPDGHGRQTEDRAVPGQGLARMGGRMRRLVPCRRRSAHDGVEGPGGPGSGPGPRSRSIRRPREEQCGQNGYGDETRQSREGGRRRSRTTPGVTRSGAPPRKSGSSMPKRRSRHGWGP